MTTEELAQVIETAPDEMGVAERAEVVRAYQLTLSLFTLVSRKLAISTTDGVRRLENLLTACYNFRQK